MNPESSSYMLLCRREGWRQCELKLSLNRRISIRHTNFTGVRGKSFNVLLHYVIVTFCTFSNREIYILLDILVVYCVVRMETIEFRVTQTPISNTICIKLSKTCLSFARACVQQFTGVCIRPARADSWRAFAEITRISSSASIRRLPRIIA